MPGRFSSPGSDINLYTTLSGGESNEAHCVLDAPLADVLDIGVESMKPKPSSEDRLCRIMCKNCLLGFAVTLDDSGEATNITPDPDTSAGKACFYEAPDAA